MKLLLRVESGEAVGDRVPVRRASVDVSVELDPTDVIGRLAARLGPVVSTRGEHLVLVDGGRGRYLAPDLQVTEAGLVSGDTVQVSSTRSDRAEGSVGGDTGAGLHLVVTSGPDAGRSLALVPGRYTVGRDVGPDWGADAGLDVGVDFPLADPQISRHDFTVRAKVDPRAEYGAPVELVVDPGRDRTNELRLNGEALLEPHPLSVGDELQVGATTLRVRRPLVDRRPTPVGAGSVPFERTPQFPQPVQPKVFNPLGRVPSKPTPRRFQLLAVVAPLLMGFTMFLLFDSARFLLFAAMSPVIAIGNVFDSRRSGGKDYKRNIVELRERIAERQEQVAAQLEIERDLRRRGAPDLIELAQQALSRHKGLWNRPRGADDFLQLRAGLGSVVPSITIKPENQGEDDLRVEVADAFARFDRIVDVPVTLDLVEHPVAALIGRPGETASFASALALQAACLHSPEDLVIVSALADTTGADGGVAGGEAAGGGVAETPSGNAHGRVNEWLKWLPHVRSKNSPLGGSHLAGDPDATGDLLRAVGRVAEARAMVNDQRLDVRWPWILLLLDRDLEPDPAIVARLLDLGAKVGISVVWLTDDDRHVPRQVQVVARLRSPRDGIGSRLSYVDPELAGQDFEPVRIGVGLADRTARALAPLHDASATNAAASVPSLVTLFEALGIDAIDPEWVIGQWSADRGYALPSPVGLTDSGPLILDLVRHGPHGLIGGTSGAGKSELVQSLVANLIALNSPKRVNLLFIDYKGGALSGLFGDVPHAVGAVTNLDSLLSLRALTSLKAELDRRMALFEARRVKDLAEMLERHPNEAPASLVIVVDEFASLVRELPEFVEGIVSIAERGRSLGIHLLLSTQRPSGSINENIQQNTNLRMALRMLDSSESTNVIGTADAATIPGHLKGRGFARLGPGELIAFQSSWSGAPVTAEAGPRPITIAPFTTLPLDRLPLTGLGMDAIRALTATAEDGGSEGSAGPTQLDALLGAIVEAAERLELPRGRAPWMPTLPNLIQLDDVLSDPRAATGSGSVVTIGMIDNPEAQDQYPANVDLADGGGLAIYGSGGSGRTTALITTACSAAIRDSQHGGGGVTIFGLDFGSRQLGVLSRLPQCEAVVSGDDLEAVTRIIALLSSLFARRQAEAAQAVERGEPAPDPVPVLLLIDGYDNLTDVFGSATNMATLQPWQEQLTNLITQGRQVGLYTILATGSLGGSSGRLANAISNRLTLRQTDDNAYRAFGIPGAMASGLNLLPGQALTRSAESLQIAVVGQRPGPDGPEVDPEAVATLAQGLVGSAAPECRTSRLPEVVALAERSPSRQSSSPSEVALGLADLSLAEVSIDLTRTGLCVLGPPRSGRSSALAVVASQLAGGRLPVWAFGPEGSAVGDIAGLTGSWFGRAGEVVEAAQELATTFEQFPPSGGYLLFDDADRFEDMALNQALKTLVDAGVRCVGTVASSRNLVGTNPFLRELRAARILLALHAEDEAAIQGAVGRRFRPRPGLEMGPGRGVLIDEGHPTVVQVFDPDDEPDRRSERVPNQGALS